MELRPLVYSSLVTAGGLGLKPAIIGVALCLYSLFDSFTSFAWLCRKIGTRRLLVISVASLVAAFLAFPVMNWFSRTQLLVPLAWVVMSVQFAIYPLDGMAFYELSMKLTGFSSVQLVLSSMLMHHHVLRLPLEP
jgi:hypothetical protein